MFCKRGAHQTPSGELLLTAANWKDLSDSHSLLPIIFESFEFRLHISKHAGPSSQGWSFFDLPRTRRPPKCRYRLFPRLLDRPSANFVVSLLPEPCPYMYPHDPIGNVVDTRRKQGRFCRRYCALVMTMMIGSIFLLGRINFFFVDDSHFASCCIIIEIHMRLRFELA